MVNPNTINLPFWDELNPTHKNADLRDGSRHLGLAHYTKTSILIGNLKFYTMKFGGVPQLFETKPNQKVVKQPHHPTGVYSTYITGL